MTENGMPNNAIREIGILKQVTSFDHPNIVKWVDLCFTVDPSSSFTCVHLHSIPRLIDVCIAPSAHVLYLVFEHLEQDLADYLYSLPPNIQLAQSVIQVINSSGHGLPKPTIYDYNLSLQRKSMEILTGISFLHSHRIVHRDLKPQNILVSSSGLIKIADFGLAKIYDYEMKLTSVVVTLWYRSPEILLNQQYTSAVDIWSVACIIAEIFQLRPLFPGTSEKNQLERILELTGSPFDWPENTSLEQDSFPVHEKKEPKDICEHLCEYSNDLLDVRE